MDENKNFDLDSIMDELSSRLEDMIEDTLIDQVDSAITCAVQDAMSEALGESFSDFEFILKDGTIVLEKVGEENINDAIQACKDSTDIATIIAYYNQTGDESVLNRYVPSYGDFTELPKSLAEFLQLRIDSENFFNALPVEVKMEFDNDSNKFFAQAGEESWYNKLQPVVNTNKESEVNNDVEE